MGTREPSAEEVRQWLARTRGASAGTFADAARFGELVVLAVQGRIADKVVDLAGPSNFSGKIVIDCTNPLADAPPENGVLKYTTGPNESLGEKIQALLRDAHVVESVQQCGQHPDGEPAFRLRRSHSVPLW
jgi:8-hydroxy-5-deazaflavin:NADPH oxidoreductase